MISISNLFRIVMVGLMSTLNIAGSMRIDLESGQTKCISEDIKHNGMTVGKYSAFNPNDNLPLPESHKLVVSVTSPIGNNYHYGNHVESGNFAFTADEAGEYATCFFAPNYEPPVTIPIDFEWKTGVSAKDWPKIAKKHQVDILELEMKKLVEILRDIHDEMFDLRKREWEMQDLNRSTNSTMATFSFLSILVSLSVAALQLWYLKSFFERKKLI